MREPLLDREALITGITTFLASQDDGTLEEIRGALNREINDAGPEALVRLSRRLTGACAEWSFYPSDPLARRIHRILAERLLQEDSALFGIDHVDAVAGAPVVVLANHLSYSDANLLEVLLVRSGGAALADRLTAIAGPKVYSSRKRRFSSLCFGTIRVPQSAGLSSEDAVMTAKDVARAARRAIEVAHERLAAGDALVVFPEGSRSRTRDMQQTLAGVARYLDVADSWILPVGITGTEAMFPVGDEALHRVRVVARVGRPIRARTLGARVDGDRRLIMDVVGLAIARLLPVEYRGAYGDAGPAFEEARRVLLALDA